MPTSTVDEFEESVAGTGASCRRTTAETLPAAVDDVVEDPAVGVELPFEGVSLLETAVTLDPPVEELEAAATGVTPGGLGIANYGTVTVDSRAAGDELLSLYPRHHVAVVAASDVVADMPATFERLAASFDDGATGHVLTTGPSATADMGSLVEGVHGPERVDVVVLEDR